jgi:hypothetical protein
VCFQQSGITSLRLLAGLVLMLIGIGAIMWLYRPSVNLWNSNSLPMRKSPDSHANAIAEVNKLRREAAGKFRKLADDHEIAARQRLANAITRRVEQSRQREAAYADWLLSTGATLKMAKAWYDDGLAEMLETATEQRMLSRQELAEAVNSQAGSLRADLVTRADEISRDYNDRIAAVLKRFDASDRLKIEAVQLPRYSAEDMRNPAINANLESLANFIGIGLIGDYAGSKFVSWLGTKVVATAGIDAVFADTGPVGWVAGLTVGLGTQWAIDKYYIKPRLLRELDGQLDSIKLQLLAADGPVFKLASDQADLARQAATELEKPLSAKNFEIQPSQSLAQAQ